MKKTPLFQPAMAGGLFAVVFALTACSRSDRDSTHVPMFQKEHGALFIPHDSPLRQRLKVATVEDRSVPHTVQAPAMVEAEPARTVNIVAPLAGRLVELDVQLGQTVQRGQTLARIASGDMDQAYADDVKARDALTLASKALQRARSVHNAGGTATKDLEAAQSNYNQAFAEQRRASARLVSLSAGGGNMRHGSLVISAPRAGVITALATAPGSYLNDLTTPLMTISDLNEVWISADIPESQLAEMQLGLPVKVKLAAYPDITLHGTINTIEPILESDTRRSRIRMAFSNPDGRLKPNMFATASIAEPEQSQVLVPQSALLMNNDSVSVFVETKPWTFVRRTVDISYDENALTRVQHGLLGGERIIVSGGVLLNDD